MARIMGLHGYTETELKLAVRQEKLSLVRERVELVKRMRWIDARMGELDTADNLLDGEF